jgi:hypothetical protein
MIRNCEVCSVLAVRASVSLAPDRLAVEREEAREWCMKWDTLVRVRDVDTILTYTVQFNNAFTFDAVDEMHVKCLASGLTGPV